MNYDLSWLASSFSPSNASFSKLANTLPVNRIEPWESISNVDQVCRNLNREMLTNKKNVSDCNMLRSNATNFSENSNPLRESSHRESLLNIENELQPISNWLEMPFANNIREKVGSSSSNLGCLLNSDGNSRQEDYWASINSCFPIGLEQLKPELNDLRCQTNKYFTLEDGHDRKIGERINNVPMTPIDSFSSPTSAPPPKLNADLIALMQELALITNEADESKLQQHNSTLTPFQSPPPTPTKGCVFCKNNCYHSTFYKSHVLKDDNGHCKCPVLRTYICPLCGGTGDFAHTLKYCPRNTVTRGDPIAAGLPPGKVTNWREVANKLSLQRKNVS